MYKIPYKWLFNTNAKIFGQVSKYTEYRRGKQIISVKKTKKNTTPQLGRFTIKIVLKSYHLKILIQIYKQADAHKNPLSIRYICK